jgi:hypothetical protein
VRNRDLANRDRFEHLPVYGLELTAAGGTHLGIEVVV